MNAILSCGAYLMSREQFVLIPRNQKRNEILDMPKKSYTDLLQKFEHGGNVRDA